MTEHSEEVARNVPHRPNALDQLIAEGRASDAAGDLLDLMDELQLPAPAECDKPSASAALAELLVDER